VATSSAVIRAATPADLGWLARHDAEIDAREHARKIREEEIFVAEVSGECVGLLRLEFLWSKCAYIANLRVREEHRRRGVGRAFLRFLDDHLARLGCTIVLSSSQADAPEAQAWHRRMGFEECGVLSGINPGGVGEIFFRRKLGAPVP
jgi:ribosomal protein S18 acetylase RimI-like enzyme